MAYVFIFPRFIFASYPSPTTQTSNEAYTINSPRDHGNVLKISSFYFWCILEYNIQTGKYHVVYMVNPIFLELIFILDILLRNTFYKNIYIKFYKHIQTSTFKIKASYAKSGKTYILTSTTTYKQTFVDIKFMTTYENVFIE